MKAIIKLLIVAVVLNAAARSAMAAWSFYQFKDASQQIAIFAGEIPEATLHERVMETAARLGVPVAPEQVTVRREGPVTLIEAMYEQPIELFPNYTRRVPVSFSVEGRLMLTTPR
jgi:hypothetical protein